MLRDIYETNHLYGDTIVSDSSCCCNNTDYIQHICKCSSELDDNPADRLTHRIETIACRFLRINV